MRAWHWWTRIPADDTRARRETEWAVRRALFGDPRLRDFDAPGIRIHVSAREVVLSGAVSTEEARRRAEHVAALAAGAMHVRSDLSTDGDLTAKLRTALTADPCTSHLANDAVVFHGVVELRGRAPIDAQLTAIRYARAVDGVRDVANYLQATVSTQMPSLGRAA